ncbi:MAG: response regulator [Woeseiaceae bacterium]|nr:response regulator [Woeseiaceae bacterium]
MSLGKKIAVLFLVLGIVFSLGSYLALRTTILPAFEAVERENAGEQLARVLRSIDSDLRALEVMNQEYSIWDHTYFFAQGERPEYLQENMDPAYWHSVDLHLMALFDAGGSLLYGLLSDPETGERLPLTDELTDILPPGHPLVAHDAVDASVKGLLRTRAGLLQVVSYPILPSDGAGPIGGALVTGQFLGDSRLSELAERATAELDLHLLGTGAEQPEILAVLEELGTPGSPPVTARREDSIHSFQLLRDISGEPAALLEVVTPRTITAIGAATIRIGSLILAGASAVFLLVALAFLQRRIVRPVRTLTGQILSIRETGDLAIETDVHSDDEVGVLADEFVKLTGRLREAHLELEQARDEALEMATAKSDFLARMSHEIRTPMNGVLGMTELLRNTQLKPKQQRFVETIYESAGTLLKIINDILDFSKVESGKLQLEAVEIDLRTLVEETVESVADQAHHKGLELTAVVPPGMRTAVITDPLRLRQVLTNLIGNAIKFTHSGEIIVRLEESAADGERVGVRFEVQDTGIGISPEKTAVIFDSFTQEDGTTTRLYGGTGLGLAISSQIVGLMGGRLEVESEQGTGSKFFFTLAFEPAGPAAATRPSEPQGVAGKRILVVDDNATNREILEHQLSSWFAAPVCAADADEAMQFLRAAAEEQALPDLVILDMHMPRTDGLELARTIRGDESLAELRIIVLSSLAAPATRDQVRDLRIAGQLTKPVRQSQLYDVLLAVFAGASVPGGFTRATSAIAGSLSGRVLLAEDNRVNQAVATGMLEHLGLEVEVAENGREAVEKASRHDYDVVLMDCQMPVLDGLRASRRIRELECAAGLARLPIVAVTANALKGDREACLAAGMDEYLAKPFTGEQLHSVLSPYVQQCRPVGRPAQDANGSGPGEDQPAPVDRSALKVLADLQPGDAESFLEQVIGIYVEESRALMAKLAEAVREGNADEMRECAHSLKSSSGNVGAGQLAALCKRIETMARERRPDDARELHETLVAEYERVIAALRDEAA